MGFPTTKTGRSVSPKTREVPPEQQRPKKPASGSDSGSVSAIGDQCPRCGASGHQPKQNHEPKRSASLSYSPMWGPRSCIERAATFSVTVGCSGSASRLSLPALFLEVASHVALQPQMMTH